MDFSGKRIAVLDTIHGGLQICKALSDSGADAIAMDIYRDVPALDVIDGFDVVIAPVHAYTEFTARADKLDIPVLTHHQAVGILSRQSGAFDAALVFEITGVKGKTTTASLLGNAYSDRRLVALTSRGLEIHEDGRYVAKKRLSITPANILTAIDLIREFDFDPEVCIFEVSLGGTGIANVNIITTLSPEYGIAQNTKTSTFAKLQMVSNAKENSCLIASTEAVSRAKKPRMCLNTFGDGGANVRYIRVTGEGASIAYSDVKRIDGGCASGEVHFALTGCYDFSSYERSLLCFTAAALSSNLAFETIERRLSEFKGVMGRMSVASIKGRVLIDNSNSGLDELAIKEAIRYGLTFKTANHKMVLIIGEEAKNICAGIPADAFARLAHNDAIDHVISVGEYMYDRSDIKHANDLESALRAALVLTTERDVIVSCVKMWR